MKEKVIEILKNAEKSLEFTEIVHTLYGEPTSKEFGIVMSLLNTLIGDYEVELNKKGKYQLTNFVKGKLDLNSKGFGFVCTDQNVDYHISKNNLGKALDGDVVLMEKIFDKKFNNEGKILKIIKRNEANLVGEVNFIKEVMSVKLLGKNINIELDQTDKELYTEGQIVVLEELAQKNNTTLRARIKSTLGYKGEPDIDVKIIALKFDLKLDFPDEVIDEVLKYAPITVSPGEAEGRKDLRNLRLVTIDGSDTKDIDDAIYAEKLPNGNIRMLVAIADVSYYLSKLPKTRDEALVRGTSNYLTSNYVIPMLPQQLSNGICSLNEGVDRLAVAFDMEINQKGDTVSFDVYDAIMHSNKKMTYQEVNKVLEGNTSEEYKEYEQDLLVMKEAADRVRKYRSLKGAVDFEIDEAKIVLDDNGVPIEIARRIRKDGEMLIEDFMVTTNIAYGTYILNLGVAALYRIHDKPSPERLNEFMKFTSLLGLSLKGNLNKEDVRGKDLQLMLEQIKETKFFEICSKKLLRAQKKAEYSPINIGHFALGVMDSIGYIQITSPIRRGPDFVNHEIGKELRYNNNFLIEQEKMQELESKLVVLGDQLSKLERRAEACERDVDSFEMAYYMENHIGEEFEGTIDGIITKGFFIETNNLISGLVPAVTLPGNYVYNENLMAFTSPQDHRGYRLGDKVTAECVGANRYERTVDFKLVLKKDAK